MDKKECMLVIEHKELETELNLTNNYKELAYDNFKDYREAVNKALEEGFIDEKKYNKKFAKKIKYWEDIFEPKPEEEGADIIDTNTKSKKWRIFGR